MNKKLLAMLENIENKKQEMRGLIENKKVDEAKVLKSEIENLKEEYDLAKFAFDEEKKDINNQGVPVKKGGSSNKKDGEHAFMNALRLKDFDNNLVSKDNEAGGYTVPEDIRTNINRYLEAEDSLQPLVRVSRVTTETGERTFQKRSASYIQGFVTVEELEEIEKKGTPQFERLEYRVVKYAGLFRASNEVLADSDAALADVLVDWIGNMSRVTRNRIILNVLNQKEKTAVTHPDDIKKALTVTLDPAFRTNSVLVTNQDGFHYLDTLKFADGRYMLQETIAFRTGYSLLGRQVVVLSNNDLPSVDGKAPLIMGNLREAVELFDRQRLAIRSTDTGGDAFVTDSVLWRGIERLDCVMRDEQAFVYGQVDVDALFAGRVARKAVAKKADD